MMPRLILIFPFALWIWLLGCQTAKPIDQPTVDPSKVGAQSTKPELPPADKAKRRDPISEFFHILDRD